MCGVLIFLCCFRGSRVICCYFWRLSAWSRGMIPASGAGGPGFDPRSGPPVNFVLLKSIAATTF